MIHDLRSLTISFILVINTHENQLCKLSIEPSKTTPSHDYVSLCCYQTLMMIIENGLSYVLARHLRQLL